MRSPLKSPYLWAMAGAVILVVVAWVGRESYQPITTGSRAPSFEATNLQGEDVGLADYEGKVLLLNVWATWCPPCEAEMPSMQRLYEELQDPAFEILAVSVDAPVGEEDALGRAGGDLEAFAQRYGLTFPILHNPSGSIQRSYQTTGVPETFIIGRDGIIYRKVAGPTDWDAQVNQELIRRLLGD